MNFQIEFLHFFTGWFQWVQFYRSDVGYYLEQGLPIWGTRGVHLPI